MKLVKVGNWEKALRILDAAPKRLAEAQQKAVLQEAQFFRGKIVEGIREQAPGGQAFAPLAPTTLAIRQFRGFRGTKALIHHGDLRNSVAVVREGDNVFVGVLRSAQSRDGASLANVAAAHEYGSKPIARKLSAKARAFLHAAFRSAGLEKRATGVKTGVVVSRIPARPFLGPVFEKYRQPEDVARRFLGRIAKLLGGDFGTL